MGSVHTNGGARAPRVHIWQFDVLRGVAVLGVIFCHASQRLPMAWVHWLGAYGWCGVDLFFVLSGFLITGILVDSREAPGYFTNFYAKRILRIWPLYFAVLGMLLVVMPHLAPAMMRPLLQSAGGHLWLYPFFVQNLSMPITVAGPLAITWSLAIEEQFYFVWPLLVFFLSEKALRRILVCVLAAEPLVRISMSHLLPQVSQYQNTFTRLDGLAAGCFLALALRQWGPEIVRLGAKWILVPAIAAVAVCVALKSQWPMFSALGLACAAIVALAITTHWMPRNRWLEYTGKISFGLYMLHLPMMDVLSSPRVHAHLHSNAAYCVAAALGMYGLASASFYFFEKPILRLKQHFETPREAEAPVEMAIEHALTEAA
jgi:peptidoglycan/LPS O-acetylase OafA/YrhL